MKDLQLLKPLESSNENLNLEDVDRLGTGVSDKLSDIAISRRDYAECVIDYRHFDEAVRAIHSERKNGSLTINFQNGIMSGTIKWQQTKKS